MFILSGIGGLLGLGGGAAAGGATAAAGAASTAAGAGALASTAGAGISISQVLEGVATVGGVVSSIAAGAAQAQQNELAAQDAEQQQSLENLQGISRRRSLKLQAIDAIGAMQTAYAGSGVDLSFGTAAQARQQAFRELDLATTTDTTQQMGTLSRLAERAANYRTMAKQAMLSGIIGGLTGGAQGLARIAQRY